MRRRWTDRDGQTSTLQGALELRDLELRYVDVGHVALRALSVGILENLVVLRSSWTRCIISSTRRVYAMVNAKAAEPSPKRRKTAHPLVKEESKTNGFEDTLERISQAATSNGESLLCLRRSQSSPAAVTDKQNWKRPALPLGFSAKTHDVGASFLPVGQRTWLMEAQSCSRLTSRTT